MPKVWIRKAVLNCELWCRREPSHRSDWVQVHIDPQTEQRLVNADSTIGYVASCYKAQQAEERVKS